MIDYDADDESANPRDPDRASPRPPHEHSASDRVSDSPSPELNSLLAPGGKVDPDLVRAAAAGNLDNEDSEVDDDGALTVHFKLTRDLQKRLDKYLQDRIPFMSRTQLQRLIHEEAVTVNGRAPKPSTTLRLGDEVAVVVPPPPTREIPAENIPLDILFEDDDIIVVNKQPGVIVHPARGARSGTLVNALAYHFQHRSSGSLSSVGADQIRPGVVHRLDRHTSGVMVAAKTDVAHWRLGKQFEERTTDKRYLAIVHGRVEPVVDEINLPIGKHPRLRELQAVRFDESAKEAVTIYRVREQFDDYALVELELRTGRTHQIRVHLAYLGWPIVGDDLYGGRWLHESDVLSTGGAAMGDAHGDEIIERSNESDGAGRPLMLRQALHATTLAFHHPRTRARMTFIAPLWNDIANLVRLLRAHRRLAGPIAPAGATIDIDRALTTH